MEFAGLEERSDGEEDKEVSEKIANIQAVGEGTRKGAFPRCLFFFAFRRKIVKKIVDKYYKKGYHNTCIYD